VTGGAGYIGAHACKALARAGYLPVTYDSLVYGHLKGGALFLTMAQGARMSLMAQNAANPRVSSRADWFVATRTTRAARKRQGGANTTGDYQATKKYGR